MNFTQYDHSFCEASIYGGPPEYFNSLTSLFITYVGYYGLKYNFHSNNDIFLLYAALLINGITSCAYHWTNYLGFGLLDRGSMILIAYPSISAGIKELNHLYNFSYTNNKLLLLFNQIYFTFLITTFGLGYEETFNGLFGFFLAYILIFLFMINHKKSYFLDRKIKQYILGGFVGVGMILIAGISWIIIEKLCNRYTIMKYLQGHAVWHIFVSSGGYLASLLLTSLSIYRKKMLPWYNLNDLHISFKN
jgi:hypothetical protein